MARRSRCLGLAVPFVLLSLPFGSVGCRAVLGVEDPSLSSPYESGDVVVRLSKASHFESPLLLASDFCHAGEHCFTGDFDGRGKADIAVVDAKGGVRVALSNGVGFGAAQTVAQGLDCAAPRSCIVANVDGLRGDDFVQLERTPTGGGIRAIMARGDGTFEPLRSVSAFPFCSTTDVACLLGDLNGDHRADALLLRNDGTTLAELGTDTGFAQPVSWGVFDYYLGGCASGALCALVDTDADGTADLVNQGTVGASSVLVQPSMAGELNRTLFGAIANLYAYSQGTLMVVDVDGDRRADIVNFLPSHEVNVLLGSGLDFKLDPHNPWATSVYTDSAVIEFGDFDGDGRADLISFSK